MARLLCRFFPQNLRKCSTIFLAFIWITGLICGASLFRLAGNSFSSLMRGAVSGSVSIVSLLSVSLLPFLFSAFAVYIRSDRLLATLCFIKGCLFALVSCSILSVFGSAGWLIRILLMFSDLLCIIPLWRYWIFCTSGTSKGLLKPLTVAGTLVSCIVYLDYTWISPLLVKLIEI